MRRVFSLLAGIAMLAIVTIGSHSPVKAQGAPATIQMKIVEVAGIIGLSGGTGTLQFNGQAYPLRVGGLSVGLGFALAALDLKGTVHNLTNVQDVYGVYSSAGASAAFVGGGAVAVLTNARGVRLEVAALQVGVALRADLSGINVQPR